VEQRIESKLGRGGDQTQKSSIDRGRKRREGRKRIKRGSNGNEKRMMVVVVVVMSN
jgi:hypothetical protein